MQPVDINQRDEQGNTALHHACKQGHAATVTALLARGANYGVVNKARKQAIDIAIEHKHFAIVILLLEAYKDVWLREKASSILHWAVCSQEYVFAEQLLKFPVKDVMCGHRTTLAEVLRDLKNLRYGDNSSSDINRYCMRIREKIACALLKDTDFLMVPVATALPQPTTVLQYLLSDPVFDNCVQVLLDTKPTTPVVWQALLFWAVRRGRDDVITGLNPVPGPVVPAFNATQQPSARNTTISWESSGSPMHP